MKTISQLVCLALFLVMARPASVNGQSVGRIRKSLDKATGGATAKPGTTSSQAGGVNSQVVAKTPQDAAAAKAQADATAALYNKKNKEAQAGADQRVVDFLKQRIEDGSADAAYDLGKRYEEGKGVEEDPVEARKLYKLAAKRGNEDAQKWLSEHPAPEKSEEPEATDSPDKLVKSNPASKPDPAADKDKPAQSDKPAKPEKPEK